MFLLNMEYIFCYMALLINTEKLIAVGSSSKSQGDSIMQNVKASERAHIAAENKARQISDIVNKIKEMSPESSQEYIQQVVMSLLGATEMYEEAMKQQKRATASLLATEAVMLEVLGHTQTLWEPMKTFSTYVPKVNPCFWCSQKFSSLVALNFHFQSKHQQKLKEIVSLTHICNSYKMYIISDINTCL